MPTDPIDYALHQHLTQRDNEEKHDEWLEAKTDELIEDNDALDALIGEGSLDEDNGDLIFKLLKAYHSGADKDVVTVVNTHCKKLIKIIRDKVANGDYS